MKKDTKVTIGNTFLKHKTTHVPLNLVPAIFFQILLCISIQTYHIRALMIQRLEEPLLEQEPPYILTAAIKSLFISYFDNIFIMYSDGFASFTKYPG